MCVYVCVYSLSISLSPGRENAWTRGRPVTPPHGTPPLKADAQRPFESEAGEIDAVQNNVSHLIEKRVKAERAKALEALELASAGTGEKQNGPLANAERGSILAGGGTGKSVEVVVGRDSEPEVGMRVRMRKAFMCRGSGSISSVCVCVCVFVCVCMYDVCMYVYTYIHTYMCDIPTYIHTCVCVCVCVCVYMKTYMHNTHTHTHTHTLSLSHTCVCVCVCVCH